MEQLFLPVLSHFQNGNPWTGSAGRMRCRILPTQGEQDLLTAQVWEGPWAYEFSTMEATKTFPLSEAGLGALAGWLEEWRRAIQSRPKRSLDEDIARRAEH